MSIRALGYIGLGVSDLERWERFATHILGLVVEPHAPGDTLFCRVDERHHRIVVGPQNYHRLPQLLRDRRVSGLVQCSDPDGIATEIFWGPLVEERAPFVSPRALSGFVTGDGGLGHIVLTVADADASMHFYRDVLGLRISDFIEFERLPGTLVNMAFLHCNSRHHSLAFMQLQAPKRLSHLMLEAREIDDVGRTYSLCEAEHIPITMTLGRHTNDEMLSFYMATPSGFNLEFGWGGKTVDDAVWQVERYHAVSVWGHRRQPVVQPLPIIQTERVPR